MLDRNVRGDDVPAMDEESSLRAAATKGDYGGQDEVDIVAKDGWCLPPTHRLARVGHVFPMHTTAARCEGERWVESKTALPFRMCLADGEDNISRHIAKTGMWEADETTRVDEYLRTAKKGTVVDVQAHLGWYTLLAAARGFRVAAFEPNADLARRLVASVVANGWQERVSVYQALPADADGIAWIRPSPLGTSRTWATPFGWEAGKLPEDVRVRTVRLDDVVDKDASVPLIKFDAEGFLGRFASGAEATLARTALLVAKMAPAMEEANRCSPKRYGEWALGAQLQLCSPDGLCGSAQAMANVIEHMAVDVGADGVDLERLPFLFEYIHFKRA